MRQLESSKSEITRTLDALKKHTEETAVKIKQKDQELVDLNNELQSLKGKNLFLIFLYEPQLTFFDSRIKRK